MRLVCVSGCTICCVLVSPEKHEMMENYHRVLNSKTLKQNLGKKLSSLVVVKKIDPAIHSECKFNDIYSNFFSQDHVSTAWFLFHDDRRPRSSEGNLTMKLLSWHACITLPFSFLSFLEWILSKNICSFFTCCYPSLWCDRISCRFFSFTFPHLLQLFLALDNVLCQREMESLYDKMLDLVCNPTHPFTF